LNVLVVEPNTLPYEKEINGLDEMQAVVGGLIQAIYPFEDRAAVVCNDESLLIGLPFNRSMEGGYGAVFGTFFVCGLEKNDFCSLTPDQMKLYKKKFEHAELLLGFRGNEPMTLKVPAKPKEAESKSKQRPSEPER